MLSGVGLPVVQYSIDLDDLRRLHHTYMLQSEKVKRDWVNTLRCAKLQMSK